MNTILRGSLKATPAALVTRSSLCRVKASINNPSLHAAFGKRTTHSRSELILIDKNEYAYWTVVQCRLNDRLAAAEIMITERGAQFPHAPRHSHRAHTIPASSRRRPAWPRGRKATTSSPTVDTVMKIAGHLERGGSQQLLVGAVSALLTLVLHAPLRSHRLREIHIRHGIRRILKIWYLIVGSSARHTFDAREVDD